MRKVRPDIKPCPYTTCGHQAVLAGYNIEYLDEPDKMHYQVECETCCAAGPLCDDQEAAVQEWNAIERHEPKDQEPELKPCPMCGSEAERLLNVLVNSGIVMDAISQAGLCGQISNQNHNEFIAIKVMAAARKGVGK